MMKIWIYGNHICKLRSEELYEGRSSQLYSQSCNYPGRWRISHYINLNNIFKVVSSQRVSLNAGQESSPQHGLLPFSRQSCSTVAASHAPLASVTTARCWKLFSVVRVYECGCPGARKFCWATCSTCELHFYAKETWPIPFFRLFHTFILRWLWTVLAVCITCYSWAELLFILFRFGGSVFCVSPVFVRSRRENLLLLSWQSLLHVHSLSRYFFICVTGRPVGLIVLRTFLNLSKMMYRLAFSGSRHRVFIILFFCGYCGSPAWGVLKVKSKT